MPDLCMEIIAPQAQSLGFRQENPLAVGRSNPFRPTTRSAGVILPEVAVTFQTVRGGPGGGPGGGPPSRADNLLSLCCFDPDKERGERPANDVRSQLMNHQARDCETMRSTLLTEHQVELEGCDGNLTVTFGVDSHPSAGLGLQVQSTCMQATARDSQNDDEVPADRRGRQPKQVVGPEQCHSTMIYPVWEPGGPEAQRCGGDTAVMRGDEASSGVGRIYASSSPRLLKARGKVSGRLLWNQTE